MNALHLSLSIEEAKAEAERAAADRLQAEREEAAREDAIRLEKEWLREGRPLRRAAHYHPDCAECCAKGRCHFCLTKPSIATLQGHVSGYRFGACRQHWDRLAETLEHLQAVQGANTPQ